MSMRNTNKRSGSSAIDAEVQNLFKKKGRVTTADFARLRSKYDDVDIVQKIQDVFTERHVRITKRAKKFARLVREKYSSTNTPFHVLLNKALAYKKKHNINDIEFAEFQRIYEQELAGTNQANEVLVPHTNMMKVLGNITTDLAGFNMKVTDDEYRQLQEILNIYKTSRPLHAQVMLQSMQYRDCDYESMTGKYSRVHNQNPGEHVHPVIAAMFFPKLDCLDHHFLYSNLAGIVSARKNRKKLATRPDYELFYSLVTDPNDVVCDYRSPVADLLARVNLQQQLWNSVLHLRNGQYYNSSFREFITSIDVCKLNKHDNPDLIYGRYDGTICKRLLSAFSFRPTVVATSAVIQRFTSNPYHQNVKPKVRQVQMINLRLTSDVNDNNLPVDLTEALSQQQLYTESGRIVPKHTKIIYSRGVLFFYVDRRANLLKVGDLGRPFDMSKMPYAVSGFERLNDRKVTVKQEFQIGDDIYRLRSVVCAEVNRNDKGNNLVVGSSTLLMTHPDPDAVPPRYNQEYFHYDPLGVLETGKNVRTGQRVSNPPVTSIPATGGILPGNNSFMEQAQNRGVLFMYELQSDSTKGVMKY